MSFKTLAQIKSQIKNALDLNEEEFIPDDELLEYINEAITMAESEIHELYENYFLAEAYLPITAGQSEYDLPANIFASKIRGVTYTNGNDVYDVHRIRAPEQFHKIADLRNYGSTEDYCYILKNDSTSDGVKLVLFPAARSTEPTAIKIWYIRDANKLAVDSDICDIPEFYPFVVQYVKVMVYEKEMHPNLDKAVAKLEKLTAKMRSTLAEMVPDEDNTVNPDLSHYWEHS